MTDQVPTIKGEDSKFWMTMTAEFSNLVVSQVMQAYDQSKLLSVRKLKIIVRENISIDGFRPGKAPHHLIQQAFLRNMDHKPQLREAVFEVWGDLHSELISYCKAWWLTQLKLNKELSNPPDEEVESREKLLPEAVVTQLVKDFPGTVAPKELELAMYITIFLKKEEEVMEEKTTEVNLEMPADGGSKPVQTVKPASSDWKPILDLIRQFPAEDSAWSEIDRFIEELKLIASEKSGNLESKKRLAALDETWVQSRPMLVEKSTYFEIPNFEKWSTLQINPDDIDGITGKINELLQQLEIFKGLDRKPEFETRAARVKRDKERLEAEEKIQTLYNALAEKMVPVDDQSVSKESISANLPVDSEVAIPLVEVPAEISDQPESAPEIMVSTSDETPIAESPTLLLEQDEPGEAKSGIADVESETSEAVEPASEKEIHPEPKVDSGSIEKKTLPESLDLGGKKKAKLPELEQEIDQAVILLQETPETGPDQKILESMRTYELSTAYWLAWSQEKQGKNSLVPSQLIAALQGMWWSIALWPDQPADYLASISNLVNPNQPFNPANPAILLMRSTAGIYYNLITPDGDWSSWIEDNSQPSSPLGKLIDLVVDFSTKEVFLEPNAVQLVVDAEAIDQQIIQLVSQARLWQTNSLNKSAKLYRAAQVWQDMVRPAKGELYKIVDYVARDYRNQVREVEQRLIDWQNRDWLDKHLDQIDYTLRQKKGNKIVGSARDQIVGWVEDICETVQKWCSIVKDQEEAKIGRNWKLEQTRSLCAGLEELLEPMRAGLSKQIEAEQEPVMQVAYSILDRTLEGIQGIVSPHTAAPRKVWPTPQGIKALENVSTHYTLDEYLARALIFYPELDLGNNGSPDPMSAGAVETTILNTVKKSPEEAIQEWIDQRDYRFVGSILKEINNRQVWEARISEAVHSDATRLCQKEVDETIVAVEQALLEGIIAEGEHTTYNNQIESVRKQIRQTDTNDFAMLSIRTLSEKLQSIRTGLDEKRLARLKRHQAHWEQLLPKLPRIVGDDPAYLEQIKAVFAASLEEYDLRASGEYLAHLDTAISKGTAPDKAIFESSSSELKSFKDFQETLPNIVALLEPHSDWSLPKIREAIMRDEALPNIPRSNLAKPRRDEVGRALEAWRHLKADGPDANQSHLAFIPAIMSYLGFTLFPYSPVSIKSVPGGLPNFQYWKVSASANEFSPVAQFGSMRNGYYDVLGVWYRPGVEIIGSQVSTLMQQTGNNPTILLYFYYLTPARRESLLSNTRKNDLPVVVIDEGLMIYLAREQDTRIKPMFQCSLPYAALNPYFPSAAGLVPPELYKGRHDLVTKLIDPFGPAIVYGGRQLGKSALLRQVEREFHHPDNGQYAIYADIKSVGDLLSGKNYETEFRDRFTEALANLKLIEPQRSSLDLDRLFNHLQQNVLVNGKRLLLLLDEADHFLDADAGKNFLVIQKLKTLMDQTGRNFKIILAGLHNVQRFQRISNQPLAHLGTIEIGPLEPKAARDLLVDPLHALGYRFGQNGQEDNSLVLHILSYTNYHPGLIQLFGSYLYEHLLSKYQQPSRPPLFITRSDVEAVYRKKDVRNAICERFNWTLSLDPRYEAIALALVLEQWDDQNGFDRPYTPKELHALSQSWWPEAFGEEITPDRFKSFLDEMRGLGVLSVSENDNSYRLRSPNLVYLMGTHDQLWDRMDSLTRSIPPGERAMESFHAKLETGEFSPLNFANERSLNEQRSGVALIFGPNATGINNLDNALQRLVPAQTGKWKEIRIAVHGAESIQQQLKSFVKENPKSNFLLAYRRLDCDWMKMLEEVTESIQFCSREKRGATLRVVFGLDSQAAWEWLKIPREQREALEEQVEVNLSLKRWDRVGMKQRLEWVSGNEKEIMVSDRLLSQVIDSTGGWPNLLDEFASLLQTNEPSRSLELLNKELSDQNSPLCKSFTNSLEIFEELPRKFINRLAQEDAREMLKDSSDYMEVLQLVMEDTSQEMLENLVMYCKRLSIISTEPQLSMEASLQRAWHVS